MAVMHTAYALNAPGLRRSCEQIASGTFRAWGRGMGGTTFTYLARDLGWELTDRRFSEAPLAALLGNVRTLPGLSDRLSIGRRFVEAMGRDTTDGPSVFEPLLRGSLPLSGLAEAVGEPVLGSLGTLQSYMGGILEAETVAAQRRLLRMVDVDVAVDRIRQLEVEGVDFLRLTGSRFKSIRDLAAFAIEDGLRLCNSLGKEELMWVILM